MLLGGSSGSLSKSSEHASGSTKRRDGNTTEWWMIVQCDRDIGAYYRHLYRYHNYQMNSLKEPLWGTHVSIIRDEKPSTLDHWKSLEGSEVEITYSNQLNLYSGFGVLEARCEYLLDYRESLGLSRQPELPLHMTIGYQKS